MYCIKATGVYILYINWLNMEVNVAISNSIQNTNYSKIHAQKRMTRASEILGNETIRKLFIFTKHLQGAQSADIANDVQMPIDTVNGLIKKIYQNGLPALEDRRSVTSAFLPHKQEPSESTLIELKLEHEYVVLSLEHRQLQIPRYDSLLCRSVLLLLLNSGWLSEQDVAGALGLSTERVRKLKAQLKQQGAETLVTQHQGQQQDYRTTPETKAELIQQYILNLREGKSVSAAVLKHDIESRNQICPSIRTITKHLHTIGFKKLQLLPGLKKNL